LPRKGYTSISIPDEMIKEIDKLVAQKRHGYSSRPDVIADAVRRLMKELKALSG
jgi:metal-responsive CopG/Arc/MetJ family transcriptional regulator